MGANVGPVGVFSENKGRFVAVPNGHDAWHLLNVGANEKRKFSFDNRFSVNFFAGNVLEKVGSVVAERIMNQRMIAPIINVEIGGSVFCIKLNGRNFRVVVGGDASFSFANDEAFTVKIVLVLEIEAVEFLIPSVDSENAVGKWNDDGLTQQFAVLIEMRFLVLDAIERIEVFVRSGLANGLSCEDSERSPFGYIAKRELMSNANAVDYSKLVGKFYKDHIANDKNEFIAHFDRVYGDAHGALPIWMAVEVMTFGTVEDLYRAAKSTVQQSMAKALGVRDVVLMSWLKTLRSVRNLVAHHGRLWNRVIRMKPLIPAKGDLWRNPVRVGNDRVFCVLCICRFLLRTIAPQSKWQERLEDLFAEYPDIALADLGFPSQWKTSPLWQ